MNPTRAAWSRAVPRVASRATGAGARAAARALRASKGSAARQGARGSARPAGPGSWTFGLGLAKAVASVVSSSTGASVRIGNSVTPIRPDLRVAVSCCRCWRTWATASWTCPCCRAEMIPPAASMAWKAAQPARAIWSVRVSRYQAPAAGSATRPRLASSISTSWVLRACRRAKSVGRPRGSVKGASTTASAPPTPAANPAAVSRSRFTQGSSRESIRADDRASMRAVASTPQAWVSLPHRRRRARSLAIPLK